MVKELAKSWLSEIIGALVVAAIIGLVGLGSGLWTGFSSFRNDLKRFSDRIDYLEREHEREHIEFKSCLTIKDGKHINQQITGISETLMGLGEKCQTGTTKLELLDAEIRFLKQRLQ